MKLSVTLRNQIIPIATNHAVTCKCWFARRRRWHAGAAGAARRADGATVAAAPPELRWQCCRLWLVRRKGTAPARQPTAQVCSRFPHPPCSRVTSERGARRQCASAPRGPHGWWPLGALHSRAPTCLYEETSFKIEAFSRSKLELNNKETREEFDILLFV